MPDRYISYTSFNISTSAVLKLRLDIPGKALSV